jgi:hypothetical protein
VVSADWSLRITQIVRASQRSRVARPRPGNPHAGDALTQQIARIGYWSGLAACTATVAFVIAQLLQLVGVLRFPWDEILIYGTSFCIVVPFLLEMTALHHVTPAPRQFWTHAALLITVIYAVFVAANYVVQLATVVPAKLRGPLAELRLLEQTPHSMFWDYDAVGYLAMGLACALLLPAIPMDGADRWVRRALLANALVSPLIGIVYFAPTFSTALLFLGFPWAITAPWFMLMVARLLLRRSRAMPHGGGPTIA